MKNKILFSLIAIILAGLALSQTFNQLTLNINSDGNELEYIDMSQYTDLDNSTIFFTSTRMADMVESVESSEYKRFGFTFKIVRGNDEDISVFLFENAHPNVDAQSTFDFGNYIEIKLTKLKTYINVIYDSNGIGDSRADDNKEWLNDHMTQEMWVQVTYADGVIDCVTNLYNPQRVRHFRNSIAETLGNIINFNGIAFRVNSDEAEKDIHNNRSYIQLGNFVEFMDSKACEWPEVMVPDQIGDVACRNTRYFNLANNETDYFECGLYSTYDTDYNCTCDSADLEYLYEDNKCICSDCTRKYNPLDQQCHDCPTDLLSNKEDIQKCSFGIFPKSPRSRFPQTCGIYDKHPQMHGYGGWACLGEFMVRRTYDNEIQVGLQDGETYGTVAPFDGNCTDYLSENYESIEVYNCSDADIAEWDSLCREANDVLDDVFSWKGPSESEVDYLAVRRNYNGDIECLSYDGVHCQFHHFYNEMKFKKEIRNLMSGVTPLACGDMHMEVWGFDGYSKPGHWCEVANRNIYDGNCEKFNP